MPHVKVDCDYCPPGHHKNLTREEYRDWEMHPSWMIAMEGLNAYSDWVSSVVLPIAFQWIDENRPEVYATISDDLKDDVGVVTAAAFKLVRDLPAYKNGMGKRAAYEAAVVNGDTSRFNPVWTSIVKKVRTDTEAAFAEQSSLLRDLPE